MSKLPLSKCETAFFSNLFSFGWPSVFSIFKFFFNKRFHLRVSKAACVVCFTAQHFASKSVRVMQVSEHFTSTHTFLFYFGASLFSPVDGAGTLHFIIMVVEHFFLGSQEVAVSL